jgi:hypothetical protein
MVDWAWEKLGSGQASEILDQRTSIGPQGNEMNEVKALLEIKWQCTDSAQKNLHTMEEVVTMLKKKSENANCDDVCSPTSELVSIAFVPMVRCGYLRI